MAITDFFAGIAVADFASMLAWYERLLGKPPDLSPREGEAVWHVSERGWLYILADPQRAGRALITLMVDDLDTHLAQLADGGFPVGAIEAPPGALRKSAILDPEGNRITFGQPPARAS